MTFFDVIKARHSIRAFKSAPVEEAKIQKILEVMNSAPSAGNLQSYEVILVKDVKTLKALAKAAYGQDFVAEAPIALVFFINPARSKAKYGSRGTNLYCYQDTSAAIAYAQLAATALGLGSVWVGAFSNPDVSKAVNAPQELLPAAIVSIGYPAESPPPTPRRSLKELVKMEKF